jgi:hypothetical protein
MVSVVKEMVKRKVNFKHGYITVLLTEYMTHTCLYTTLQQQVLLNLQNILAIP